MAFINTEDVIGAQALEDQYLERTLTEFRDDRITLLKTQAFASCAALTVVDFPHVTTIDMGAFNGCNALRTIILRAPSVCVGYAGRWDPLMPSNDGLYVYVPAALVESYKVATNWSEYADRIRAIEDYPEITGGL